MRKLKFYFTLTIIILVGVCARAQHNDADVKSFWKDVEFSLCKGDIESIKKQCTPQGFLSFLGRFPESDRVSVAKQLCNEKILKIDFISEKEVKLYVGIEDVKKSIYASAFLIECVNLEWKIIKYLPAK